MTTSRRGYRGYIGSRPVRGTSYPQRVQNLVVRDYAARNGLHYLLSATEHCMPGSYMILRDVLNEFPKIDGIICFSLFALPADALARREIYARVLGAGGSLHAALEDLALRSPEHIDRFEDLIAVSELLERTPFSGRDDKQIATRDDAAWQRLLDAAHGIPT